jgi:DNA-binding response OmpR family regulator
MASPTSILLVEDDTTLAATLDRYLTARGYDVHVVDTVEEATRQLGGGLRPGLVVLDVNLPGDTGWALMRGTSLAAAGSPPVIVATATAVSPSRLRESGVAGYLPKPFALETLTTTIERLTRRQHQEDGE